MAPILWIGPNYRYRYNFHHELFADAVIRKSDNIRYGPGMDGGTACFYWDDLYNIPKIVEQYHPSAIVCQHVRHCGEFSGWNRVDIPRVAIMVDYFPRNYELKNSFLKRHDFNMACFPERRMVEIARDFRRKGRLPKKMALEWLPFSVDTNWFKVRPTQTKYDVMCLFSVGPQQPRRKKVYELLKGMEGKPGPEGRPIRVFAKTVWSGDDKVRLEDYARLINQSKICVASNDQQGSVNLKHLEYLASHSLLLSETAMDFGDMGLLAGKHYIEYSDPGEIPGMVAACLRDWNDRYDLVRHRGWERVIENHSTDKRAEQFRSLIGSLF